MSESAISCRELYKRYPSRPPVEAVRGLDLEVFRGECFGLLGPNGAGKTTTVEMIEGLMPPTSGEIKVFGEPWGVADASLKQRIGISLQETRFPERLTVREIVALFRSFYHRGLEPNDALALVSLQEKASSWVSKLSGGQKQRLAVATALVGDPELLALDEPTTGLDPQSRLQLWDIIGRFKSLGRTVLLTTHYMDEAERLCDRVAVVDHGKVIALGTPRELIARLGGDHVIELRFAGPDGVAADAFAALPSVRDARKDEDAIHLSVGAPHVALPAVLAQVEALGRELASLTTRHASLEDVFVTLTGRRLRDGDDA